MGTKAGYCFMRLNKPSQRNNLISDTSHTQLVAMPSRTTQPDLY